MEQQCNCQKENKLLVKKNNTNYLLFILIIIGLFLIFKSC